MIAALALRIGLVVISFLTRPEVVNRLASGARKTGRSLDDHLVELLRLGSSIFHPQSGPESGPAEAPWIASKTKQS